jgi:PPOX class probable F420-dependent enzyme
MARTIATDRPATRAELEEFIRPRHQGILATTRRDGSPQMSPVTLGLDAQGRVVIASYPERAKSQNLQARPEASVCVVSDDFGDEWVQVSGRGEVLDLPEALEPLVEYYRVIAGDHPDWEEYRQAMTDQGKVLLRVTIDSWGPISRGGFPARLVG